MVLVDEEEEEEEDGSVNQTQQGRRCTDGDDGGWNQWVCNDRKKAS